jgi:hypothetical protein
MVFAPLVGLKVRRQASALGTTVKEAVEEVNGRTVGALDWRQVWHQDCMGIRPGETPQVLHDGSYNIHSGSLSQHEGAVRYID